MSDLTTTTTTPSSVNFASLNADKSFWDQIFEVRSFIDSKYSDIWTEDKRKNICGKLDVTEMKKVLDAMLAKGQDILNLQTATGPLKLLIDTQDESGIAKISMALKYPNEVFNTAGNYESYMDKFSSYSSSSYDEFANNVQKYGNEIFKGLNSTIVTTISIKYPGTSGSTQCKLYDALIQTTGWESQSDSSYTQLISVNGILDTDMPVIDIVLSDTTATAKQELKEWSKIGSINTQSGALLVRCLESKPTVDLNIKLQVIRGA